MLDCLHHRVFRLYRTEKEEKLIALLHCTITLLCKKQRQKHLKKERKNTYSYNEQQAERKRYNFESNHNKKYKPTFITKSTKTTKKNFFETTQTMQI